MDRVSRTNRARKIKAPKAVVYPLFIECASLVSDPYWADRLTALAYDKTPRFFSFSDGHLIYRKGSRTHQAEVPSNPYEAASFCVEFFRTHGGLFSPDDGTRAMEAHDFYAREQAQEIVTWSALNNRGRSHIVNFYIGEVSSTMSLTREERNSLQETLNVGIILRYFGESNIEIEGRHIHRVRGLLWDPEARVFYRDPDLQAVVVRPSNRKTASKESAPLVKRAWLRHVKKIDSNQDRVRRRPAYSHDLAPDSLELGETLSDDFGSLSPYAESY